MTACARQPSGLHCGAALGCEVALTQQVLVAWSVGDWFGGFALIKLQSYSHISVLPLQNGMLLHQWNYCALQTLNP